MPTKGWLARLEKTVRETESGCWEWVKATNASGYGVGRVNLADGTMPVMLLHRAAWEATSQALIPDGHEIDHVCNNPPCVNPRHMQVISRDDHISLTAARRLAARSTEPPIDKRAQPKPFGSIRKRSGKRGDRFAVLYRERGDEGWKQTSRTFDTETEAEAFLAELARPRPYRKAS